MKVFITCTPEFSEEILDNVVETLNQTSGVIEFIKSPVKSKEVFQDYYDKFNDNQVLSNNEFFEICEIFRRNNEFDKEDYFVIISDRTHSSNWFSAFRGKNIFIIGSDWDHYTKKDYRYPISFQVVENLFQTLCNIKIEEFRDGKWVGLDFEHLDKNIHFDKHTCVNSMCADKKKISDKFISGYICDDCYQRAQEKIKNPLVLSHIESLLSDLRNRYVLRGDSPEKVILPIQVTLDGRIQIGDVDINLTQQPKSFYIHFLITQDKVKTTDISKKGFVLDVYSIYNKLKNFKGKLHVIASKVGWKKFDENNQEFDDINFNNKENLIRENVIKDFEKVRNIIKKSIIENVGENFSKYYEVSRTIDGGIHYYKVQLDYEKRDVQFKI
ncbi:hypothetical protein [Polaribacter tangerinus]|uniref:hypothetical protein n=1 Tax=Polaribacter tangerinus TaxID=1920034 RepID=UPI000B4BA9D8|nr:hypothetical protein [Polaribacter tangerinus]